MIKCYIDGACGPKNPGGAMGWGGIILQDGIHIEEFYGFHDEDPENSNNVAEYLGLQQALVKLEWFGLGDEEIIVYTDSQLVTKQMNGVWKIKHGLYKEYALSAKKELKKFENLKIEWIPREENEEADRLSKMGFFERGIDIKN